MHTPYSAIQNTITALLVVVWLALAALVWGTLPLPQPPMLAYRRRWAAVAQPWRGRVAVGIRIELSVLSR